jgi:hypothetical protein
MSYAPELGGAGLAAPTVEVIGAGLVAGDAFPDAQPILDII